MQPPARTIYLFERGILGWQSLFGDWKNWPNQACAWINQNTPHKSQTLTYFIGPILAGLTRRWRARNFAKLIQQYRGSDWKKIIIAHSEGTATVLLALKLAGWPAIEELHLVCGAADADFNANGLNMALASGKIGRVHVYVAGQDAAMRLEDTYAGSLCFGLQTGGQPLGLKGPENASPTAWARTRVHHWHAYGHSTCWRPRKFNETMEQLTASSRSTLNTKRSQLFPPHD